MGYNKNPLNFKSEISDCCLEFECIYLKKSLKENNWGNYKNKNHKTLESKEQLTPGQKGERMHYAFS